MLNDADDTISRVEDDVRRARTRAERLSAFRHAVEAVRGTATSRERDLTVTVDAGGVVSDLRIADSARHRSGARLAPDILSLVATAQQRARQVTATAASDVLGDDDPIVTTLHQQVGFDADTRGSRQDRGSAWPRP